MTADDKYNTHLKKVTTKKSIVDESFDDIELDLDLDEEDDLSSELTDLEDIDLEDDDDNESKNEVVRKIDPTLDTDDLFEGSKKLLRKIPNKENNPNSKLQPRAEVIKKPIEINQEGEKEEYLRTLAVIELKTEELNNIGLDITIINDLINETKKFVENDDFSSIKTLIRNSENLSNSIFLDHRMNLISTIISFIETFIFDLTELELDFKYAEAYFTQAKNSLLEKNLSAANKYLGDTINNVRKVLDNSRAKKLEEALKFFEYWLQEISELKLDVNRIEDILEHINKSYKAKDLETAEKNLQKLIYTAKGEINKKELDVETKEDHIQQLEAIYEFEDFSSLNDAIIRVKNMLNEALEKDILQVHLDKLISIYRTILTSKGHIPESKLSKAQELFNKTKDLFEKEDYNTMDDLIHEILPIIKYEHKEITEKKSSQKVTGATRDDLDELDDLDDLDVLSELTDLADLSELENIEESKKVEVEIKKEVKREIKTDIKKDIKKELEKKKEDERPKQSIDPGMIKRIELEISNLNNSIGTLKSLDIPVEGFDSKLDKIRKLLHDKTLDAIDIKIQELHKEIRTAEEEYNQKEIKRLNEQIEHLTSDIETAKLDNINTKVSEDLLNYAKQRLKSKKFTEVEEIVKHSKEVLMNAFKEKHEVKPKTEVKKVIEKPEIKKDKEPELVVGTESRVEIKESINKSRIENEMIKELNELEVKTTAIEMPDTKELLKEAFGFKLKREGDETSIGNGNGTNIGEIPGKIPLSRPKPEEIQQIRDQVLTKISNNSNNPPINQVQETVPAEIRESHQPDNYDDYKSMGQRDQIEQITQMDEMDKIDHMDEMDQMDQMDQMDRLDQMGQMIRDEELNIEQPRQYRRKYSGKDFDRERFEPYPQRIAAVPKIANLNNRRFNSNSRTRNDNRNWYRNGLRNGLRNDSRNGNINGNRNGDRVLLNHYGKQSLSRVPPTRDVFEPKFIKNGNMGIPGLEHSENQEMYETRLNTLKKDAVKGLQEIQSIISDAYYFGANINELERISEDARNAFDDRDYQEVLLYVDRCEELSRQLKLFHMHSLIEEFKASGENTEYLEYLFFETEKSYNEEKLKIGDELARRFIGVIKDLEFEDKIVNQSWIYCRYCGNSIPRDSTFCSYCGDKLF